MRKYTRLINQSVWMLGGKIGSQLALVLMTMLIARGLGPNGFGEFATIAAVIMIGNSLTTFGTDMYLIREIASRRDYTSVAPVLLVQLVLSILFITLVWYYSPLIPRLSDHALAALRMYIVALIPLAFFSVDTAILRGEQRFAVYTGLNLLNAMLQTLVVLFSVMEEFGIIQIVSFLLLTQIIISLLASWSCFPQLRAHMSISWRTFGDAYSVVKNTSTIAGISSLRIIYQRASLIMLTLLGGPMLSGWYSAANRTLEAARIGHGSVFTVLFPIMASSGKAYDEETINYYKLPFYTLLIFASAGSAILFFLAAPIVLLLFGPGYQYSILPLKILSVSLIPYTINDYLSIALLSLRKETDLFRILLSSVILMIAGNILVIPRFGHVGASWTFGTIELFTSIILIALWKSQPRQVIGYEKTMERIY